MTDCPYCDLDTGGNHQCGCPCHPSTQHTPDRPQGYLYTQEYVDALRQKLDALREVLKRGRFFHENDAGKWLTDPAKIDEAITAGCKVTYEIVLDGREAAALLAGD